LIGVAARANTNAAPDPLSDLLPDTRSIIGHKERCAPALLAVIPMRVVEREGGNYRRAESSQGRSPTRRFCSG
jgi:hypothetical protein